MVASSPGTSSRVGRRLVMTVRFGVGARVAAESPVAADAERM